jgi:hypothetical protein
LDGHFQEQSNCWFQNWLCVVFCWFFFDYQTVVRWKTLKLSHFLKWNSIRKQQHHVPSTKIRKLTKNKIKTLTLTLTYTCFVFVSMLIEIHVIDFSKHDSLLKADILSWLFTYQWKWIMSDWKKCTKIPCEYNLPHLALPKAVRACKYLL